MEHFKEWLRANNIKWTGEDDEKFAFKYKDYTFVFICKEHFYDILIPFVYNIESDEEYTMALEVINDIQSSTSCLAFMVLEKGDGSRGVCVKSGMMRDKAMESPFKGTDLAKGIVDALTTGMMMFNAKMMVRQERKNQQKNIRMVQTGMA